MKKELKWYKSVLLLTVILAVSTPIFAMGGNEAGSAPSKYPEKPVQCIIPYAPGGGSDIITRTIMKYIVMPQPLVGVNIEGASGFVGAMQAYQAKNDGYTILAHNPMDVVSYTLSGQLKENMWSDMEYICDVVADFNVVGTNKQSGWKTIEEVVTYAKANPGKIRWGVTGQQTVNMADTIRIVEALGLTGLVTLVPYDGGAASRTALMGNHIQVETNSSADIRAAIQSGDNIPLMVVNDKRIKALPNVPATTEKGVNVTTGKPRGYYAPKGTSSEKIKYIADAMKVVVERPEFIESVANLGLEANFVDGLIAQKKVGQAVEVLAPIYKQMTQK